MSPSIQPVAAVIAANRRPLAIPARMAAALDAGAAIMARKRLRSIGRSYTSAAGRF